MLPAEQSPIIQTIPVRDSWSSWTIRDPNPVAWLPPALGPLGGHRVPSSWSQEFHLPPETHFQSPQGLASTIPGRPGCNPLYPGVTSPSLASPGSGSTAPLIRPLPRPLEPGEEQHQLHLDGTDRGWLRVGGCGARAGQAFQRFSSKILLPDTNKPQEPQPPPRSVATRAPPVSPSLLTGISEVSADSRLRAACPHCTLPPAQGSPWRGSQCSQLPLSRGQSQDLTQLFGWHTVQPQAAAGQA